MEGVEHLPLESTKQRSHLENLCHAADRLEKLKNMLKESENEVMEYKKKSYVLKNVEHGLKRRLVTAYACHEMLSELKNDHSQWSIPDPNPAELQPYREEKSKYLTMLDKAVKLNKVLEEADALFGEQEVMANFRKAYDTSKLATAGRTGLRNCSKEFVTLYETSAEVENVIEDKKHQIDQKKSELEMLKFREQCRIEISAERRRELQKLQCVKSELERKHRASNQGYPVKLGILVECYEKLLGC